MYMYLNHVTIMYDVFNILSVVTAMQQRLSSSSLLWGGCVAEARPHLPKNHAAARQDVFSYLYSGRIPCA